MSSYYIPITITIGYEQKKHVDFIHPLGVINSESCRREQCHLLSKLCKSGRLLISNGKQYESIANALLDIYDSFSSEDKLFGVHKVEGDAEYILLSEKVETE